MVSKLFVVASVVSFIAAAIGEAVFGVAGLELVAAGLAFHVSADLAEDLFGG